MSETNTEHEKEPIVTADAPSTAPPKEASSPHVPSSESNGLKILKAIRDKTWVGLVVVLPKLENAERCAEAQRSAQQVTQTINSADDAVAADRHVWAGPSSASRRVEVALDLAWARLRGCERGMPGRPRSGDMGSRELERIRGYGALVRGVRALDTQPRLPLGGGSEGVQGGHSL